MYASGALNPALPDASIKARTWLTIQTWLRQILKGKFQMVQFSLFWEKRLEMGDSTKHKYKNSPKQAFH